ncbi:hypothetical protein [Gallionella capsiferriformans]|uniref:Prophage CP4-57 regulatory n=1 Tax=Gallionella capsiferriformans (strain ES-2) TaxID=395494 RepID=D9SGA7_GALCS|nr:hypothetical protein [Gallionella capsiferriformans]ADL55554.1 hypothetical protein Galf_1535 [Gallionella capsiferriformans ES-2]
MQQNKLSAALQISPSFDVVEASHSFGNAFVNIDQLARIICRSPATIRTQVTREPNKLPPRVKFKDGTTSVVWSLKTVWSWLDQLENNEINVLSDAAPAYPKSKRGKPTNVEKNAAQSVGMSVIEYRKSLSTKTGV